VRESAPEGEEPREHRLELAARREGAERDGGDAGGDAREGEASRRDAPSRAPRAFRRGADGVRPTPDVVREQVRGGRGGGDGEDVLRVHQRGEERRAEDGAAPRHRRHRTQL
jgi:hypothetical protein